MNYSQYFSFCCLNFTCHKINVVWYIYIWLLHEPNVFKIMVTLWCCIIRSLWCRNDVINVPSCVIFKTIRFLRLSMQFSVFIAVFVYFAHILHILLCYFIGLLIFEKIFSGNGYVMVIAPLHNDVILKLLWCHNNEFIICNSLSLLLYSPGSSISHSHFLLWRS